MTTNARALRTHEAVTPDWEAVKGWAKAAFTKERMREAALCVATVTFAGLLVFSLHRAMEHYIILGF
jgi:predicted benzoate:H+ symporter BenE